MARCSSISRSTTPLLCPAIMLRMASNSAGGLNQRTKYRTGKLASWKIEKLNALDFPWAANRDNWKIGFEHAKQYLEQNGNLKISQTFVTSDGYSLGFWLATQRQQYSKGKLNAHRIEFLEGIGFIWEPQEYAWNHGYAKALKYYEKHGCMDISAAYVSESGFKLGEWVWGQNWLFLKGTLKPERQLLLENVGVDFNSLLDKPRKTQKGKKETDYE